MKELEFPPETIGLPKKFTSWRPQQGAAILHATDGNSRFRGQICPTGAGKSLSYMASAILRGGRAVILTSTKGLQSQLMRDFESIGLVDVRGRNSYPCIAERDDTTCDHGPCIAGLQCPMKNGGCEYYDAIHRAQRSDLVVTNYAYWMSQNRYGGGFGDSIDTLICDEAHNAPDVVSNFMTISLDKEDEVLMPFLPDRPSKLTIPQWKEWAEKMLPAVQDEGTKVKADIQKGTNNRSIRRRLSQLIVLEKNLSGMKNMTDYWICDTSRYRIEFCPVWPAPYAEGALFLGVPRVIMTSASMCKRTVSMLGVVDDYNELEFQHSFPLERRRLIHVPTVRMNYRTSDAEMRLWVSRIDQILRGRQDRKGIIHTVSYKRAETVMMNSRYMRNMIDHQAKGVESAVKLFKRAKAPAYLVSPSVTTGFDFPYEDSSFQIIGKIAYPDSGSRLIKERSKTDKNYNSYVAMQQLVQTCGRSMRAADDFCENIIIDDNITWFIRRHGHFAPKWFTEAFTTRNSVPKAPEL